MKDLVRVDVEDEDLEDLSGMKLCLTTKEACAYLGIGRTVFWKVAHLLPAVNLTGRRYWCRRGLERWVKANTTTHNANA